MKNVMGRRDLFRVGAAASVAVALGAAGEVVAQAPMSAGSAPVRTGAKLDHRTMQVLFADLQVPLVATSTTVAPAALSLSSGVLAQVATILQMPTLFSVVPLGSMQPPLIPELRGYATAANTILRTPVSPFGHAPTAAALSKAGRRTLVIAGFATEVVVLQAALDAIAAGYTVYYVSDATGSKSQRTEIAAQQEMELAGAIPTSVLSLATRLVPDFVGTPGAQVFAALQPLLKS